MQEYIINNIEEWDGVAKFITTLRSQYNLFYFKGDLGVGKTTLIQKVVSILGSKDQVVSPSFALVNIYGSPHGDIFHLDLYRLNDIEEAIDLGIEEYIYNKNYCFIEWPEIIESISPEHYFEINIEILGDFRRKVIILEKEN